MIKSMTGYGQGRATSEGSMFTVQVQSVNRKFLEISVNLDREFMELESAVRQQVGKLVHRGRINVFIQHEMPAEQHSKVVLNKRLAREYLQAYRDLQKQFQLRGEVDLKMVVAAKDVVQVLETHPDKRKIAPLMFRALDEALRKLDAMRIREGKSLEGDFRLRLKKLASEIHAIKKQVPQTLKNYQDKWRKRLAELQSQADSSRIDREVASFADKIDISEETVRFESHLQQFAQILSGKEPKGKPLDFLVQELVREANTIGSKANDLAISKRVIIIKSELEKVREQVQNIE